MKAGRSKNPNIIDGPVDIPKEILIRRNQKLRITMWLDGDLYDELKRRARKGQGNGQYQTLMNEVLRIALLESEAIEPAVSVSQLKGLVKDLERGYNPFARGKKAAARPKRKTKKK